MSEKKAGKIIEIATIDIRHESPKYLLLRSLIPNGFEWFFDDEGKESPVGIMESSIALAFRKAWQKFKLNNFLPIFNGYRYSLPERDEHGMPATFYQMAKSYGSSNGVYFDEDLGYNCIVHNAPLKTLQLYRLYQREGRLDEPLRYKSDRR